MTWLKDRAKCRGHRASGDLDVAATHLGEFPQCSCVGVRIEGTEFVGNPAIRPPAGGTPGQVLRVARPLQGLPDARVFAHALSMAALALSARMPGITRGLFAMRGSCWSNARAGALR